MLWVCVRHFPMTWEIEMRSQARSKNSSSFQEKLLIFPLPGWFIFSSTAFRSWNAASQGSKVEDSAAKYIKLGDKSIEITAITALLNCYVLFMCSKENDDSFSLQSAPLHLLVFDFIPDASFILKLKCPLHVTLFQVMPTFTPAMTTICISNGVKH